MEVKRITKEELKHKIEKKEGLVIIDVRNPISYGFSSVKIKGAIRIPLEEIESKADGLPAGKEIVAYCT